MKFVNRMKGTISESAEKCFPLNLIIQVSGISRATYYDKRQKKANPGKRGPKPKFSDETILEEIRFEIKHSKFHSEGYKKILARLRRKGLVCGKNRVLKLMRNNKLLAPVRPKSNGSSRPHDGKIITNAPDKMWGTDGKQFYTLKEGKCWLFSVIEHFNDEILGWHAVKKGDRFAALEPVKQAVKDRFGNLKKGVIENTGLFLRADHGSQYDSRDFQFEIKYLGFQYSPAFVRSPECNGIIERFHRTIEEQIFSVYMFEDLEEARKVIGKFMIDYNEDWILHRLNFMSPIEFRKSESKNENVA